MRIKSRALTDCGECKGESEECTSFPALGAQRHFTDDPGEREGHRSNLCFLKPARIWRANSSTPAGRLMPPLTATTLHSLRAGMNQSPIIFLQDALMQDWEGSAQNLATTANLKFQGKKTQQLQTNKHTDGEAAREEEKLKSL